MLTAMLAVASLSFAQYASQPQAQNPPPAQPGAATPAAPQGKRMPQAKTQPEFDAYKLAVAVTDPAALEKAAEDFATKFPDSELKVVLYKSAMRSYQSANNGDKTAEMGRKSLALDPDDPESLVDVAQVVAERTRDTDLDKDQKLDEAMKMAQHALQTVDTDLAIPANTPPDKVEAYKGLLRSSAYSILGTLNFNKGDFAAAEQNLRNSVEAYPASPDPVTVLRLALALDKQNKYPEALAQASKAVELTQEGSSAGTLARREKDRLVQLTSGSAPAKPAAPAPPKN
jgi:tetratricopeptide (TPR) repeat protein